MQGSVNQMVPPPMPQYMGMNPMQPGGVPPPTVGGLPNMQGPPNASGTQMYPQGGPAPFNRPQGGQMPMMPSFNPFQVYCMVYSLSLYFNLVLDCALCI